MLKNVFTFSISVMHFKELQMTIIYGIQQLRACLFTKVVKVLLVIAITSRIIHINKLFINSVS